MQLIEADERQAFLATLQRKGLAEGEFELRETDTTDPKSDENVGLQGYVTVTRLSTQIAREYLIGFEAGWVEHFEQDLEAGVFDKSDR